MKLSIILPAYNEAKAIGAVLDSLPANLAGVNKIEAIVIDDGSVDRTSQVAREHGATVLRHRLNRGVGLATITGLEAGRRRDTDLLVTMDSDGQHDPGDLRKLIQPIIENTADITVGTRLVNPKGMPWFRRIGNRGLNWLLRATTGIKSTDSQSGFRAYNRHALAKLNLTTSGYEICTEILLAAEKAKLKIVEVPIRTIYTTYSKRKGQSATNAINIILRLMFKVIAG